MSRKLDDWLKHWLEFSSAWESPERMRLWAGISAISAVLQRKCWTYVKNQPLYPNLYVLLVGPPGVGKGNAMKVLRAWLRDVDNVNIAPDSLTQRSFYSELEAAHCDPELTDEFLGKSAEGFLNKGHCSLSAFIEELGVFLHPGDHDFIWALCHVYDCPPELHHKTQHAGENKAREIYYSMISACTPKALKDIFTEQALELGISARTMIIYSEEKIDVPIFGRPPGRGALEKDLKYDLRRMARIKGEYQFDEEAARELVAWSKTGFHPAPKDLRFEHYNTRRFVQLVKTCMCCAASKRQDPVILPEDLFQAKTFMLEAERVMPQAVQTVGANPYLVQQQTAIRLVNRIWQAETRGVTEAEIRQRLNTELDPRYTDQFIDSLEKARWVSTSGKAPDRVFFPRGRTEEKKDDTDSGSSGGNEGR